MTSSSIFGIMLGGFMKGIEKEGFVRMVGLFTPRHRLTDSNFAQSRDFIGKGSNKISLPFLKYYSKSFGSYFSYLPKSLAAFSFWPSYSYRSPLIRRKCLEYFFGAKDMSSFNLSIALANEPASKWHSIMLKFVSWTFRLQSPTSLKSVLLLFIEMVGVVR